jgi:hypothetical protein
MEANWKPNGFKITYQPPLAENAGAGAGLLGYSESSWQLTTALGDRVLTDVNPKFGISKLRFIRAVSVLLVVGAWCL